MVADEMICISKCGKPTCLYVVCGEGAQGWSDSLTEEVTFGGGLGLIVTVVESIFSVLSRIIGLCRADPH